MKRAAEHDLAVAGKLRQAEPAAFAGRDMSLATVTLQHVSKGEEYKEASKEVTLLRESVKGFAFVMILDSLEAAEAAVIELAAANQASESDLDSERLELGVDFDPLKFGFGAFRGKGIVGFNNSLPEICKTLQVLEKSEYGKLKYFFFEASSGGGADVIFKYDGVSFPIVKNDLIIKKSIHVKTGCACLPLALPTGTYRP